MVRCRRQPAPLVDIGITENIKICCKRYGISLATYRIYIIWSFTYLSVKLSRLQSKARALKSNDFTPLARKGGGRGGNDVEMPSGSLLHAKEVVQEGTVSKRYKYRAPASSCMREVEEVGAVSKSQKGPYRAWWRQRKQRQKAINPPQVRSCMRGRWRLWERQTALAWLNVNTRWLVGHAVLSSLVVCQKLAPGRAGGA
jgi:hypothetical protein